MWSRSRLASTCDAAGLQLHRDRSALSPRDGATRPGRRITASTTDGSPRAQDRLHAAWKLAGRVGSARRCRAASRADPVASACRSHLCRRRRLCQRRSGRRERTRQRSSAAGAQQPAERDRWPAPSLPGRTRSTAGWRRRRRGVAIVDATTLEEIDELVAIALASDGCACWPARRRSSRQSPGSVLRAARRSCFPIRCCPTPIVVVCASLHPVSRAQIAKVADGGSRGGDVVGGARAGHPRTVAARGRRACPPARRRATGSQCDPASVATRPRRSSATAWCACSARSMSASAWATQRSVARTLRRRQQARRLRYSQYAGGSGDEMTAADFRWRSPWAMPPASAPRSCCAAPPRSRSRPSRSWCTATSAILRHGAELLGLDVEIEAISDPRQWRPGPLQVVDAGLLQAADHRPGVIDAASGAAARQYVLSRDDATHWPARSPAS